MSKSTDTAVTAAEKYSLSIASDLALLAFVHDTELTLERIQLLMDFDPLASIALRPESTRFVQALDSFSAEIKALCTADAPQMEELAADFAGIYLNHTYRASPLESVWLDDEGLALQAPMFEVREIFETYGYKASNWRMRSEDHLVNQLVFMQLVLETHGLTEKTLRDLSSFYDEHLYLWIERFAERVENRCQTAFYAASARFCAVYVDSLRQLFAELLDEPRPDRDAVLLRLEKRKRARLAPAPVQFVPGASPSW